MNQEIKRMATEILKSNIRNPIREILPYIEDPPDIILSIMLNPPSWLERNPEKYLSRIIYELIQMEHFCPTFEMKQEKDRTIFIEGKVISRSNNLYTVRCYYPENYPYEAAIGLVMDSDVIEFCNGKGGHDFHNYGNHKGGVKVCVMKPDHIAGEGGWKPNSTIITIRNLTIKWIHGYEYKRITGKWPFTE